MAKTKILGTRLLDPNEIDEQEGAGQTSAYWLIISSSGRRVSLPIVGEVIIGRFDPTRTDPLDVDLSYEDGDEMSISRRHARIMSLDFGYMIEDLKSRNGLFVNGERVASGQPRQLQDGDRISVGGQDVMYGEMPSDLLKTFAERAESLQHSFTITHTGRKVDVASTKSFLIGRFEPSNSDPANINLAGEGDVSAIVSRRHAKVTWQDHQPIVEDLNSTYGTRLNGSVLPPNRQAILRPGDQLSLGGCVLAYDVDV